VQAPRGRAQLTRTKIPATALGRVRGRRGTTLVEMAIVFPLLMLLLCGILDFSQMFYSRLTIQHAVREAVRFAITGNTLNDPVSGTPMARVAAIKSKIIANAVALDVDVNNITVTPANGGGPSEVVTVAASFSYEFATPLIKPFFPGGRYTFTIRSSMKNEPFVVT
jgi:Flp pilus assembly protein TadG